MRTIVRADVVHKCPHVDEQDRGRVELSFHGPAPELHKLREYLDSFVDVALTHEDFTDQVARHYPDAQVRSFWITAACEVEVQA